MKTILDPVTFSLLENFCYHSEKHLIPVLIVLSGLPKLHHWDGVANCQKEEEEEEKLIILDAWETQYCHQSSAMCRFVH